VPTSLGLALALSLGVRVKGFRNRYKNSVSNFLQKWNLYNIWEKITKKKRCPNQISKMSVLTIAAMSQSKQKFQLKKEQHRL